MSQKKKLLLLALSVIAALSVLEMIFSAIWPQANEEMPIGIDRSFTGIGGFVNFFEKAGIETSFNFTPYRELVPNGEPFWLITPTNVQITDGKGLAAWVAAGGFLLLTPTPGAGDSPLGDFFKELALDIDQQSQALPPWSQWKGEIAIRPLSTTPQYQIYMDLPFVQPGWRAVLEYGAAPLVWERELGNGRIVLINSSAIFGNLMLTQGDNASLLYDIARHYQQDTPRVTIDRYAHIDHQTGGAISLMLRPPFRSVSVGLALLVGLAILSQWFSGPPPRPAPEARRRDRSEYVQALARLIAQTRDRDAVLALYRQHLLADLHHARPGLGDTRDALREILMRRFKMTSDDAAFFAADETPRFLTEAELLASFIRLDQLAERTRSVHRRT